GSGTGGREGRLGVKQAAEQHGQYDGSLRQPSGLQQSSPLLLQRPARRRRGRCAESQGLADTGVACERHEHLIGPQPRLDTTPPLAGTSVVREQRDYTEEEPFCNT